MEIQLFHLPQAPRVPQLVLIESVTWYLVENEGRESDNQQLVVIKIM